MLSLIAEFEIFGELSDSDDEGGIVEEKDVNVLDSAEDDSILPSGNIRQRTAGSGSGDDLMRQLETSPNNEDDLGILS